MGGDSGFGVGLIADALPLLNEVFAGAGIIGGNDVAAGAVTAGGNDFATGAGSIADVAIIAPLSNFVGTLVFNGGAFKPVNILSCTDEKCGAFVEYDSALIVGNKDAEDCKILVLVESPNGLATTVPIGNPQSADISFALISIETGAPQESPNGLATPRLEEPCISTAPFPVSVGGWGTPPLFLSIPPRPNPSFPPPRIRTAAALFSILLSALPSITEEPTPLFCFTIAHDGDNNPSTIGRVLLTAMVFPAPLLETVNSVTIIESPSDLSREGFTISEGRISCFIVALIPSPCSSSFFSFCSCSNFSKSLFLPAIPSVMKCFTLFICDMDNK
mmetsp:Transcript_33070/g.48464  ORF Transcript_33070/g.48464 Transcript_33070/m.48464 type:complete len:332 (+) Transcript_33070:1330-2325(+)